MPESYLNGSNAALAFSFMVFTSQTSMAWINAHVRDIKIIAIGRRSSVECFIESFFGYPFVIFLRSVSIVVITDSISAFVGEMSLKSSSGLSFNFFNEGIEFIAS